MHLGTLLLPKSEWRKLAAVLESRLAGQLSLLEEQFSFISEAADKAFEHYQFIQSRRKAGYYPALAFLQYSLYHSLYPLWLACALKWLTVRFLG